MSVFKRWMMMAGMFVVLAGVGIPLAAQSDDDEEEESEEMEQEAPEIDFDQLKKLVGDWGTALDSFNKTALKAKKGKDVAKAVDSFTANLTKMIANYPDMATLMQVSLDQVPTDRKDLKQFKAAYTKKDKAEADFTTNVEKVMKKYEKDTAVQGAFARMLGELMKLYPSEEGGGDEEETAEEES